MGWANEVGGEKTTGADVDNSVHPDKRHNGRPRPDSAAHRPDTGTERTSDPHDVIIARLPAVYQTLSANIQQLLPELLRTQFRRRNSRA